MIREIIVTSPQGVRLAFEPTGEQGLTLKPSGLTPDTIAICDQNFPVADGFKAIGVVSSSWLIELNETVT